MCRSRAQAESVRYAPRISAFSDSDNRPITNLHREGNPPPSVIQRPPEFTPIMGMLSGDLLEEKHKSEKSLIASYASFGMAPICVRSSIVSNRPHISAILPLAIRKKPISTTEIGSPVPTVPMNSPV